ncbi:CrcB family protein [Periweissella fabalis]|uniref:Uncharacterized protein n=1 Tax=Periweissella fabalis TaxID=1070421 RepID=A0A7X6N019_9LACO|nr:hypothetical protein [Periweissella fabalis]MCM0599028.1 CrcB family protein [Periweissella fabalis]NKZ23308.1 hypothetical protein [Periweissella fabalis]
MFASKRWSYVVIVIVGLVLGAVLPNVFNVAGISANSKIIWLLITINFIGAFGIGWYIKRTYTPWWTLLIFPGVFALDTFLLKTNEHQYAYFLALTYLALSVVAHFNSWAVNVEDEGEEHYKNIVDSGFEAGN